MKISFIAFLIGLSLTSLSHAKNEAEQFKNTKWVGIYRYMDEVLWIKGDLSWVFRTTEDVCSQGEYIKITDKFMEFYNNKMETQPNFKMSLMNKSINDQNKLLIVDKADSLALTQYSYWESRLGSLVTYEGKTIGDNLVKLMQMNAPHNCKKR